MPKIPLGLSGALVCPGCHKKVTPTDDKGLHCTNDACGLVFPVRNGIPVMLLGGDNPTVETSGYYPKVRGGTMEDNPDSAFTAYDTRIRTHYLRTYLADEPRDGPILDLCCSKAPFYTYLKQWGYGGDVMGVDLLMHQLETAQARGLDVVLANALHLPFPDGRFRIVIFTDALVHLLKREDQQGAFAEITRVLAPGGCLIMTATNLTWVALMALLHDVNVLKSDVCTYYSRREIEELADGHLRIERHDAFAFYNFLPGVLRQSAGFMVMVDRMLNIWPTRRFGMVNFFKLRRV